MQNFLNQFNYIGDHSAGIVGGENFGLDSLRLGCLTFQEWNSLPLTGQPYNDTSSCANILYYQSSCYSFAAGDCSSGESLQLMQTPRCGLPDIKSLDDVANYQFKRHADNSYTVKVVNHALRNRRYSLQGVKNTNTLSSTIIKASMAILQLQFE